MLNRDDVIALIKKIRILFEILNIIFIISRKAYFFFRSKFFIPICQPFIKARIDSLLDAHGTI